MVGIFELCQWLASKGVEKTSGMNKGGTQECSGIRVTMVDAKHSSSFTDDGVITYLGEAAGYVLTFENGLTVYFAGDTALFGDMRLIHELYKPTLAFLPIGDLFTMDPAAAAKACALLGVRDGRPDALRHVPGADRPARTPAGARRAHRRRGHRDEAGRDRRVGRRGLADCS